MKHIAIITSHTNTINWHDYGKCDYCDLCSINHHEYANKHGYSYIKKIVYHEDYENWHPTWIKIDVLKTYLPLFEYVVWIDSDAIFVNQELSIEDLIQENVDLIIPKLEIDKTTGNVWTNTTTGFMVWKNTDWSKNILDILWNEPNQFRFNFFHEQSRLDELLQKNYESEEGKNILEKSVFDLESPIILENVKILPYSYHRCWNDGEINYVYHAGGDTPTKFSRLQEILNTK